MKDTPLIANNNEDQIVPAIPSGTAIPLIIKPSPYQKKISYLKKKIIFSLSISGALLLITSIIFIYGERTQKNNVKNIAGLEEQIAELKIKSDDIANKINDAKKFKQLWLKADQNKKNFEGIKVADINGKFNSLAEKYNILNPAINISVPEVLKDGIYKRQSLEVNLVVGTISFDALTDAVAINFIESFINQLPGYVIVSDLSIKKNKKDGYSDQDLVSISNGKIVGLTSAKISFSWYFLKRKTIEQIPKS